MQGAILPLTLNFVGKKPEVEEVEEIKEKLINEDKENEYWVFTDGSCNNNKNNMRSGYGIYISKNEKYNIIMWKRGKQTIKNAEIQTVAHKLIILPTMY